jgi:putative transposase
VRTKPCSTTSGASVERTVQAYGIAIDGIHYYSDMLRRFVGATENGRRRSFLFRRDPRDISSVYFWDPELQRYSPISYRNTTYPPISIWELRELRRKLQETGRSHLARRSGDLCGVRPAA